MRSILSFMISSSLAIHSSLSYAENARGNFTATMICPLYISKNNLTHSNPPTFTEINRTYKIKEVNKKPASWVRLEVKPTDLKWVEASCSDTYNNNNNDSDGPAENTCSFNSGKADNYVLAASLQAGFCETNGRAKDQPECKNLTIYSQYRTQFTLHGLWPNQNACGTKYSFCRGTKPKNNSCDYIPLDLTQSTQLNLKNNMPGYQYGSCLERHEWNKHGTCQNRSPDKYYELATKLIWQINYAPAKNGIPTKETQLTIFMRNNLGKTVTAADLKQAFDNSFSFGSSNKIQLVCSRHILTNIYINLQNLDKTNETKLSTLIFSAPNNGKSNCGSEFRISGFAAAQ